MTEWYDSLNAFESSYSFYSPFPYVETNGRKRSNRLHFFRIYIFLHSYLLAWLEIRSIHVDRKGLISLLCFYFILPSSIRFFEIDRLDRLRKYFENTINWSEIFGKTEYLDIQNVIISFLFQFKFQITLGYKLLLLLWSLWQASSRYLISLFKWSRHTIDSLPPTRFQFLFNASLNIHLSV